MPLVLREEKGSQLTYNELDGNFTYLQGLDQEKLTTSSFNTFSSSYATGSFTGSFVGDGSGLTGIPGVTPIATGSFVTTSSFNVATGSFATTGSNQFNGNQTLSSGSLLVTGSSIFSSPSYGNGIGANNSGSKFTQNTTTVSMVIKPSGSFNYGSISVSDNNDGNSTVNLYGSTLLIGNTSANSILFGNASTNSNFFGTYNFRTGVNVTGSLLVTGSANIRGGVTGSSFTGSFVGDGSGLTGIPGVTPIDTGSFATTGSNQFNGGQSISGSVAISGSISQVGIGTNNTIVGFEAGRLRTTGMFNTLIGKGAGERATIANSITLVGSNSGNSVTTGNNNTFIGASSGQATTTGDYNVAIGSSALFSNTTGTSNTVIGYSALSQLLAGSSSNIAIGYGAGTLTSDASNLSSSADSIFIGDATYAQNNSQTNQIVIGMYAVGAGSNTTMIGNDNTTATYLKGTLNVTRQILSEVSSSLNFANDTAAAAGGVPLGGLYRNGNAIQIRLV